MSDALHFELALKQIPIIVKDASSGDSTEYFLREIDGAGRDAYLNNLASRMKTGSDGAQKVTNFTGLQANLIHRSLFTLDGTRVPEATIQGFPASVVAALFNKAKELSGLDDEAEGTGGND